MGGHLGQLAFHAVETTVGSITQLDGHFQARGLDLLPKFQRQAGEALLQVRAGLAFHRTQAAVQHGETTAQLAQRLAGALVRRFQPLVHPTDDSLNEGFEINRAAGRPGL
jgi:hypothetical protein